MMNMIYSKTFIAMILNFSNCRSGGVFSSIYSTFIDDEKVEQDYKIQNTPDKYAAIPCTGCDVDAFTDVLWIPKNSDDLEKNE